MWLQVKSIGYLRTKNTRTFMCAVDDNSYSERALEWLVDGLVEDGDEVVALRVLEGDADGEWTGHKSFRKRGGSCIEACSP